MNGTPANEPRFERWRVWIVYGGAAIVLVILILRLFTLQVLEGQDWQSQATGNLRKVISLSPQRGIIYDRNGYILARNVASYNIVITPAYLPDDDADIQEIYRQISALTGVPINQGTVEQAKLYSACIPGPGITQLVELGDSLAPYTPVAIKCNVDDKLARYVREHAIDWPGVSVEIDPVRDYPTGSLTANIIGFLGPIPATEQDYYEGLGFVANRDKIGYSGVERTFQSELSGTPGKRIVERDVAGQELRNLEPPIDSTPGNNIYLTIDTRLQKAAETALTTEFDYWNQRLYGNTGQVLASSGVVIAMNPQTGEILAMVSWPSYENNRFARIIPAYYYRQVSTDPRHLLLNTAISAEVPPGSVFKLSTATGALNEGVVSLSQTIQTPGKLVLCERFSPNDPCTDRNTRDYVDWVYKNGSNPAGFGSLDFLHCIAYSSNVCFYKLGGGFKDEISEGLDADRLAEYARALGYDQTTGIELQGEANGLIPTPKWKRITQGENWSTGDTYISSVGQGYVLATPLQVLMSAATIANDGKQMHPTIIREIVDNDGNVLTRWYTNNDDGTSTVSDKPINSKSYQISPFKPNQRWDITVDPIIKDFTCEGGYCTAVEPQHYKTVKPDVVQKIQEGMRLAVTSDPLGTLNDVFRGEQIAVAGKTGTAEYCDNVAQAANRCKFGEWPTHSWTVAYAPYDNPEIVVLAFAYNGGEGASVAAPIVRMVIDAYFELKSGAISNGIASPGGG
jgi:penicillin-binding protein 2